MKTLNLYFKFQFTSLSPDAQPISLGIVSDEIPWMNKLKTYESEFGNIDSYEAGTFQIKHKSFYAEFSDFDINSCDDWVKENVVSKLQFGKVEYGSNELIYGNIETIKAHLKSFISKFFDYQIQFICDCGSKDWEWLLQLLAEWDKTPWKMSIDTNRVPPNMTLKEFIEQWNESVGSIGVVNTLKKSRYSEVQIEHEVKTGLPKLPDNISPVPFDLNDLIAIKKGITPKEAFELNREELMFPESFDPKKKAQQFRFMEGTEWHPVENKHNALFDAKVIKEIYQKLK